MTLQDLVSGKYCPFTGMDLATIRTTSSHKLSNKPPGYYATMSDKEPAPDPRRGNGVKTGSKRGSYKKKK